jgi:hypothetical protein
MARSPLIH